MRSFLLLWLVGLLGVPAWCQGGKIAFTSHRSGNGDIYVMNSDGSGQTNLSNTASIQEANARWRLDGGKLVYQRTDAMWTMNADGSGQAVLSQGGAPVWPDYHPSGNSLIFSRPITSDYDICKINSDGTGLSQILSNSLGDYHARWSPDGSKFTFYTFFGGNYTPEVCIANANGTGQTRLTTAGNSQNANWRSDGEKLVFQSSRDGNNEIYVMNPDGTSQTRLTTNTASDVLPSFSPDGSKIVFVSNRDGNNEIYVMNADGTNPTRLTNNAADDTAPAWVFPLPANPPTVSIGDATVVEGTGGTVTLNFTVTLSAASTESVAVFYKTANVSAITPSDYNAVSSSSLTFAPGETSKSISINVLSDASDEDEELLQVNLSYPVGAILGDSIGIGTITDDDGPPTLSIVDAAQNEGDTNSTSYILTVTVSAASSRQITVQYATSDDTATNPQDYTNTTGTLSIGAGLTSKTFTIPVVGDTVREEDETFVVTLSDPLNATLDDSEATATVVNDDFPLLNVSDATITEGNTGSIDAVFTVTLADTSADTVSFNYGTASGSAASGTDFQATSGSHTFLPGDTTTTISVPILGDVLDEVDESFTLTLSNLVKADPGDTSGTGTITDDDAPPTVSIADANVTEGDSGTANATLTVSLSSVSSLPVTVNYATSDGTAIQPADYTSKTGSVTIPAGSTSATFTVSIKGDTVKEADETFLVTLSSPTNATLADDQATVTILNNDPTSLSIEGSTITEGDSGQVNVTFTVTLSDPLADPVTFDFATSNNGAASGTDYIASSGSRILEAGETSALIEVPVLGDTLDEADETFRVTLSNVTNANLGISSALSTILDNDDPPVVSIADLSRTEGNSGTTNFNFVVSLSAVSGKAVTVNFASSDGTAIQPGDYTARTGSTFIFPGALSTTASISVKGDAAIEPDESFGVTLTSVSNATLGDDTATGTIENDDFPVISITGSTITETNTTGQVASFTLTLSEAYSEDVTVDFTTVANTATAGTDYTTTSGSRTFVPGQTTKTITVPITGDTIDENDETFSITLSNAVNGTFPASLPENPSTGHAYELVTSSSNWDAARTAAAARTYKGVTGHLATITSAAEQSYIATLISGTEAWIGALQPAGSAEPGGGFTWITGEPFTYTNWRSGEPNNAAPVGIQDTILFTYDGTWNDISTQATIQHYLVEYDLNTSGGSTSATATILDDDSAPQISVNNVTIAEGNSTTQAVFTISVAGSTEKPISVDVTTANGTALSGADYTNLNTTVTIPAGQSNATFSVPILGDLSDEPTETFLVNLANPFNATVADGQGKGTITNDDPLPTVAINDVSIAEGNTGAQALTFTLTLSPASGRSVTVNYATADNTAVAGSDYAAKSGAVTFGLGQTSKTVSITITGDTRNENNEKFNVNLSNPINATISRSKGAGTIINDDPVPGISINDVTNTEGNSGGKLFTFTLTLSRASGRSVTVNYATSDNSATAGSDYLAKSGAVTFAPGQTSKTVSITVNGDTLNEKDEKFNVNLSNPINSTITRTKGIGTITNDDPLPSITINDVAVTEGNSGGKALTFTLTLSAASGRSVTVNYATADGTAIAGSDYVTKSGAITFGPGQASKTVSVTITGDILNENDEVFLVNLSNPINATVADAQGIGTISNDDASG